MTDTRSLDSRKQAVSIRLGSGDLRKVKILARRLGVRDSDVIRFALKWTLNRIAPLCDPQVRGRQLVPVFVECGGELVRYFELDAARLEALLNDGANGAGSVDHDDVLLIVMSGTQQPYARLKFSPSGDVGADGSSGDATLRRYLYEKYLYRDGAADDGQPAVQAG